VTPRAELPPVRKPRVLLTFPAFPPVAAQLLRLVSQERVSYQQITELIRADAAFATEVLRLANSAIFCLRYEVVSILHAISVLGINRLKGLVIMVAMRDFLKGASPLAAMRKSWRHNLACALASEVVAEACWVDKGFGYTAGLLHDVGMLALVASRPEEYGALVNDPGLDVKSFLERERELVETDHCEVGHWLLAHWGLPKAFWEVAARHHELPGLNELEMTGVVRLGCRTASMAGFPAAGEAPAWEPQRLQRWIPEASWDALQSQLNSLPEAIACKINLFDCEFLN